MFDSNKFSLAFLAWIALVSFLSLYEFNSKKVIAVEIPHMDKIVHFSFYFIATFFAVLLVRERTKGKLSMRKAMIYSAIFLILYGALIEVLQTALTSFRKGDIFDMLANLAGIILSLLVMKYIFSSKSGLKWKH